MWVRSLGQEDPLEEKMATHSSILAWRIPMDRGAWLVMVHKVTKSWTGWGNSQCKGPGAGLQLVFRIARRSVWLTLNEQGWGSGARSRRLQKRLWLLL